MGYLLLFDFIVEQNAAFKIQTNRIFDKTIESNWDQWPKRLVTNFFRDNFRALLL